MRAVFLLMLGAALLIGTAHAQSRHDSGAAATAAWDTLVPPVFRHLTPADGLPYPVALGLAQDHKGFIWAATPGGVARWDGYRVTVFRHDDQNPASLPENIVTVAMSDENGRPWFSTASGIVLRYEDSLQGFIAYRSPDEAIGRPNGMVSDGKGDILVAGLNGLFHLDVATGTWRRDTRLPDGEVGSVMIDTAGTVWAGTAAGLMRRPADASTFEAVAMPGSPKGCIPSALYQAADGAIWFGTRCGHVGMVADDGRAASLAPSLPPSGHRVTAFAEPRPGTLWVAEYGGGIRELNRRSGTVRQMNHEPTNGTSIGDNSVTSLLIDKSGLVWASSLRGIHRHIPNNPHIMTIVPDEQSGVPGADVRSVAATATGKVWLGFRSNGLALVDPGARQLNPNPSARWPEKLPKRAVQAIADSANGRVWVGQTGGLSEINVASGRVTPYAPLTGENILALLHDGATLWAGGSMGLARIPLDGSPARLYRSTRLNPNSLNNTNVQAIFRDHAQRLWLGTNVGLTLLEDAGTGAIHSIVNDPDDPQSLPSNIVTGIAEDKFNRLWLATANGIGIFDPALDGKPRFIRLGKPQGLGNDTVLSVIEGSGGMIFAATGDGLSVIDPETLAIRTFGPAEGVSLKTFWSGSATRMTDGTLVFGGFGGFVVVRPSALPTWEFRPPVVVTETRIGGHRYNDTEDLIVRPEDDGFQVDFSALDFSAPERNSYAYRLNDEAWVEADSLQRTARYTNLPPGLHRLEVMGSNSSGIWGDPLTLDIRVLPAWYQTAWFRVLASVAFLASLGGIVRGRKTYHLRREQELNRMVAIKTAEAEAATQRALAGEEDARRAKEDAEAATEQKSRFLAIIGHEIRTPLNGLLGMVQVLSPDKPRAGQQEALSIAKQAGENLRHLVESVLEYGREGAETAPVAVENFDVRQLAAEAVHLILPQAAAKGLAVTLRAEPDQPLWVRSSPAKLSRILLNLLGNAIKFTDRGSVAVTVALASDAAGQRLTIRVTDTGIGVAPDLREAIFGEFVQADDSITRRFGGVGLGLAISRRLAAQLGGTLHLESPAAVGSSFILDIPVTPGVAESRDENSPLPDYAHSLRILVVDDDDINLLVADQLLTHLGQRASLATNGADAVAALGATEFDIVLMDLRMPDMDGMEATRRIRHQEIAQGRPKVRIIAMTAEITDAIWQQCQAAGMDAAIAKPVRVEHLREVLMETSRLDQPIAGLDMDFIQDQLDILGPREMIRLARLFQKISRDILRAMAAAGDAQSVGALAHRLASTAGPLGLIDLSAAATRLEAVSATASPEQVTAHISLVHEVRRTGLIALRLAAHRLAHADVRSARPVRQSDTRRL